MHWLVRFQNTSNFEVFRLLGCYGCRSVPSSPVQSSPNWSALNFSIGLICFLETSVSSYLRTAHVPSIAEQRRRQLRLGGSPKSSIKLSGAAMTYCREGNEETENYFRVSSVLCSEWQPFEWVDHWLCSILFFFLSGF